MPAGLHAAFSNPGHAVSMWTSEAASLQLASAAVGEHKAGPNLPIGLEPGYRRATRPKLTNCGPTG
eukprot:365997-Chlamydomonas_euryale.AAC.1